MLKIRKKLKLALKINSAELSLQNDRQTDAELYMITGVKILPSPTPTHLELILKICFTITQKLIFF